MIKKLRIKFIALAAVTLLLVLIIIIDGINIINYRNIVSDADRTLSILQENGGRFPMDQHRQKPEDMQGDFNDMDAGIMMKDRRFDRQFSPELPFESRYFTVSLNSDGSVGSVDTGKIAAVGSSEAIDYAQQVWKSGEMSGFVGDYRYIRMNGDSESEQKVIFLDCGRSLSTFRMFLLASCAISLAGWVAVVLIIVLLSGRIVKPVAESYEKQKQFITDAGHELKTPLTIINADAEILEMDLGDNEWLKDIQKQARRLSELTGDLVFLSKMDEERITIRSIEFPLSDVVQETAQPFLSVARTKGRELETVIEPMLSMEGDEKAIRQLVSILMDNAMKYSRGGEPVRLSLRRQGRTANLTVSNAADSVTREDTARLFDRFYRTDRSRNSETGGHGIGLSLAKAIVTAHKGKIGAALSEDGILSITAVLPVSQTPQAHTKQ